MQQSLATPSLSVRPQEISQTAARLSVISGCVTILLLAALHGLSPEFDPATRMVSEYALGSYGWVLLLFFLAWSLSCIALFVAIRTQTPTTAGKIGLGLLLVAAVGMGMGGLFDLNHPLHGVGALLGIPTLPAAALLISGSVLRHSSWSFARRPLLWTAHLTWISLVALIAAFAIGFAMSSGEATPSLPVGWPNRLLVVSYCVWVMVTAWAARRVRQSTR